MKPTTSLAQKTVSELAKDKAAQLEALLPQIQARHEMVERHLAGTLECAQEAGEALLEAKKLTGHGGWLPYLKECGIPARTASDYMRIAKNWTKAKSATLPDLSYRGAISYLRRETKEHMARILAQPDEPEETEEKTEDAEREARIATQDGEWAAKEPERQSRRKAEEAAAEKKLTRAQDLIVAGYKVLAAKAHPDKGGSNAEMAELNELRDDLLKIVESTYDLVRS
jgi:hypothetical protein